MKIVLAGQLDRVYSNALARTGEHAAGFTNDNADKVQFEEDRLLFHRAGTLAAISEAVVAVPNWYPIDDEGTTTAHTPSFSDFAPGVPLTRKMWAALYQDATFLAQYMDLLDGYSERSLGMMNAIDSSDAWLEDDSPRSLQRSRSGPVFAYVTELLLQPFLAWQAGAVLVISEADRHLLADVAKFLVEGGRPRPFPIPDLRAIVQTDGTHASGKLLNLGVEALADVEAERADPDLQAYARLVRMIVAAPDLFDVRGRLEAALATVRPAGSLRRRIDDDIDVVIAHSGILGNATTWVTPPTKPMVRYVRRKFAPQGLRTIVLIDKA